MIQLSRETTADPWTAVRKCSEKLKMKAMQRAKAGRYTL